MAQAILTGILAQRTNTDQVVSAGLLEGGRPMAPEAIKAVAADGPAMDGYRSRHLTSDQVSSSDLVLGMTREHVREVVVLMPEAWNYTFTLKEFGRLGEAHVPYHPQRPFRDWLAEISRGRRRSDLLGTAKLDDIADPMGRSAGRYAETAAELRNHCQKVADLLFLPNSSEVETPSR